MLSNISDIPKYQKYRHVVIQSNLLMQTEGNSQRNAPSETKQRETLDRTKYWDLFTPPPWNDGKESSCILLSFLISKFVIATSACLKVTCGVCTWFMTGHAVCTYDRNLGSTTGVTGSNRWRTLPSNVSTKLFYAMVAARRASLSSDNSYWIPLQSQRDK